MGQISAGGRGFLSSLQLGPARPLCGTGLGLAAVAFLVGQGEDIKCSPCWSLPRETGRARAGGSGEKGCSVIR